MPWSRKRSRPARRKRISALAQTLAFRRYMLEHMIIKGLKEKQMALDLCEGKMQDLGPFSVLNRGYSITRKLPEKDVLRSVSGIKVGDNVNILLAEGEMDCLVEKVTGR